MCGRFTLRTLVAVVTYSFFAEAVLWLPFFPKDGLTHDLVLNSLYGAVVSGIGYGLVYRGQELFILSNNHVLARENLGVVGEDIVQPGRYDINCANNVATDKVADLSDFEPLKFDGTNNYIDAAIALYSTTDMTCATLSNFYGLPGSTIVNPTVGLAVKKVGRTTELTTGTIATINITVNVGYTRGTAKFVGCFMTTRKFSKAGDSGSLVVTNTTANSPVGLLFAGTKTGDAICCPITPVLSRFGATICTQ